jgi:hypothetical protein
MAGRTKTRDRRSERRRMRKGRKPGGRGRPLLPLTWPQPHRVDLVVVVVVVVHYVVVSLLFFVCFCFVVVGGGVSEEENDDEDDDDDDNDDDAFVHVIITRIYQK